MICALNYSQVRGPGVVGMQPVLLPGKSFTYERWVLTQCVKCVYSITFCIA
jgi:uncharacterized protein affecting Mg2+/Co2+ transport